MAWLLVPDGPVFQKMLIYWDFPTQPSVGFTENGLIKRGAHWIVSSSSLGGNALLMSEVRGAWLDCFKLTQIIVTTQGMQKSISEHTTRCTLKQTGHSDRRPQRVVVECFQHISHKALRQLTSKVT